MTAIVMLVTTIPALVLPVIYITVFLVDSEGGKPSVVFDLTYLFGFITGIFGGSGTTPAGGML